MTWISLRNTSLVREALTGLRSAARCDGMPRDVMERRAM